MPRPRRHIDPLALPTAPDRPVTEDVRASVERYRDELLSVIWEELAMVGVVRIPETILAKVDAVAWSIERVGEHALSNRKTPFHRPPDPDRFKTPLPSTRPTPFATKRRADAVNSALRGERRDDLAGFHGVFDPDKTPVDLGPRVDESDEVEEPTEVGRRKPVRH